MSVRRVAVVGALGRMGQEVRAALAAEPTLELGAALEAPGHPELGTELEGGTALLDDPKAAFQGQDVVIDFSVPQSTLPNLRVAADAGVAYVTGTTGFASEELAEVHALAARVPVIHAPNFSLAVNVLTRLVREAAAQLGDGYDAEIFELHHAAKRDAPSGTALRLAEALAEGRGVALADHVVLERAGDTGARPDGTIGIQTLRGGDAAGEHTVMFIAAGERLELVHRATTRAHFARGAVRAAAWLVGKPPGLHPVEQALGLA